MPTAELPNDPRVAYRAALERADECIEYNQLVPPDTVRELLRVVRSYESAITWGTSCTNCAHLLDMLYIAEHRLGSLYQNMQGSGAAPLSPVASDDTDRFDEMRRWVGQRATGMPPDPEEVD